MADILRIGNGCTETRPPEEIGAKAANLARVAALGLPVPPAFVLPIGLCSAAGEGAGAAERDFIAALKDGVAFLETATGRIFGDRHKPLLVSVRSGAAKSMPGMLDTLLNVGCNATATRGLIRMTGNPGFAWDCRRRFLEGFAENVLGLDRRLLVQRLDAFLIAANAASEGDLDTEDRERLAADYEALIGKTEMAIEEDAARQLLAAARTVCRSFMSDRAQTYRKLQNLEGLKGTAITVQSMVFGNRGLSSGSGVAFSRDPSTGRPEPVIDFLFDAQGEDVVSGRRTPQTEDALAQVLPDALAQLRDVLVQLERHFADVQDIEFTIEEGRFWVLQTRSAKRTPHAALRFAVDFVREGLWSAAEAVRRLDGLDPAALAVTRLVNGSTAIAKGVGAAAGVAVGRIAFDPAAAQQIAARGDHVILLRPDISTADVAALATSAGIVTTAGGRTAHAAVVARQMGKPCIVGCKDLTVDAVQRHANLAGQTLAEGDWLSIDGGSGDIFLGQRETVTELPQAELDELNRWRAERPMRQTA